jgi:predicted DCC family thiol-disulfide oxidoreductase YuxK
VILANGWTGGQYSAWRAALGLGLAIHLARLLPSAGSGGVIVLLAIGIALALCLALGFADGAAAVVLALAALYSGSLLLSAVLAAPALVLGHPYGSLAARGRVDPRGDWSVPPVTFTAAWVVLALAHAWGGYARLPSLAGLAELAFAPLALVAPARPWIWLAALCMALAGLTERSLAILMLHGFTFDPAWLAPRRDASPATLFYDGACGLCHRAVRFVLAEDRDGRGFRYAPLGSQVFQRLIPAVERAALPDSLVLVTPDGRVRARSTALREVGFRLGGLWAILARVAGLVPAGLLDRGYDWIARMRSGMFAKPEDSCPILPPDLRDRFD